MKILNKKYVCGFDKNRTNECRNIFITNIMNTTDQLNNERAQKN